MNKPRLMFLMISFVMLISCILFSRDGIIGIGEKLGIIATAEPPGVGEKAERGYSACAPIITALEQVHAQTGEYPDVLAELVPAYIAEIPTEVNQEPITYSKTGESYSLSFYYTGPGMNACTYTPEDRWDCSGAY